MLNRLWIQIFFLTICLIVFWPTKSLLAAGSNSEGQFITIVNPVRISSYTKNIRENFAAQYLETQKRGLPATWLLTFDALEDSALTEDLNKIDTSHELGIFLEITPNLAAKSEVKYNKTDSWHRAHAVFLTGYTQEDRKKLIDNAFDKFKKNFGFYPKSVGAWWIDSFSLDYMTNRYKVSANLGLADQFATDGYHVWGQYWSTPFIPNKYHAGIPANNLNNKLNLVTIEWATRDPLNGYGGNPANNFSTQDYFAINLGDDYFSKLLNLYTSKNQNPLAHITIGLETDLDPSAYQSTYARQLDVAKTKLVRFLTMSDFAKWYLDNFPLTPPQTIITDDLLGDQKKVIWYQSPIYRIGLIIDNKTNKSEVFDFRIYPADFGEPNYLSPNMQLDLFINLPSVIDKVSNPKSSWIISQEKLLDIIKQKEDLTLRFRSQTIKFTKNNIQLTNTQALPDYLKKTPLLKVERGNSNVIITPQSKFIIPQQGLILRGLSVKAYYFLKRPKIQLIIRVTLLLTALSIFIFRRKIKLITIIIFLGVTITGGLALFYLNSQLYEVSQSEADALLHLKELPAGKVAVYDDGCLICTYHSKYPPPFFANNREYVHSIAKKPIIYNLKIFKAVSRMEGRKELKRLGVKYIYVAKFEDYQEALPFSPGDYFVDLIYENANAQIWRIRDNAQL